MPKVFDKTPCAECSYQAFSQDDLDAHVAHAHPSGQPAPVAVANA
ncbi:hypothetical protein LCGC14_2911490, partial [marine sediment metagenome]